MECEEDSQCSSDYCWESTKTCATDLEASLNDNFEDVAAGVGAFLIIVFIVIPCCICIGICWCVYCFYAKKCCCAPKGEHNVAH